MFTGIVIGSLAVFFGGIFGSLMSKRLSDGFKKNLEMIFGVCSMGMGISSIVLMENMPAVIFAIVIGTAIGLACHLGDKINKGAVGMQKIISKVVKKQDESMSQQDFLSTLVTIIVLFCASGTGIYGAIVSGMSGDHTILISKSILDFFTAAIFACSLGYVVSLIAVPQFAVFLILFACAKLIFPLTTPAMVNDFKACGGFLMLATGFRIAKLKMFPIADMLPAMVLVMPLSFLWSTYVMPLL